MRPGKRRLALALVLPIVLATAWSSGASMAHDDPATAAPAPAEPADAELAPGDQQARPDPAGRRAARYGQQKAEGSPYFYRQMILALVIVAGMIGFLAWLVRRSR
jgi:hypothetical protein